MADRNSSEFVKHVRGIALVAIFCLTAFAGIGCGSKSGTPSAGESATASAKPQTFATQDDAGKALYDAAKANDTNALLRVFGTDARDLVITGDPVDDKNGAAKFTASYEQMHRWDKLRNGDLVLTTGAANLPFPIPLAKNSAGQWFYDSTIAKDEILARRIGDNELGTMDSLLAMADAQEEYFAELHDGATVQQYAQKFVSTPGKHDGLVWNVADGEPDSPLGPLAAKASADGYTSSAEPFHGYLYRILTKQGQYSDGGAQDYIVDGAMTGGYAILAYPAAYRNSGVMTFIVTSEGAIYQKDIGPTTAADAKAMNEVNLDSSWALVDDNDTDAD
jgi:hypothetical protein